MTFRDLKCLLKKRKYVWNQMYLRFVVNALAF